VKRIDDIDLLYPPFAREVQAAIKECHQNKIPMYVFETFRSLGRQQHLYAKGRTSPGPKRTNARPGLSWHHYGIAVDVVLKIDGKYNWSRTDLYREAAPFFEKRGIYWLGRTGFELVHYQLLGPDHSVHDVEKFVESTSILKFWHRLKDLAQ
jgi:peptidoglycan LD-endopeptidase CwlK